MKIKAFADHFKVKKSTIRYYTDINLLLPEKSDQFFEYNQQCINDMNDINQLKNMGFSIMEIQHLKLYERYNINYSKKEIQYLEQIFDKKHDELKKEMVELSAKIANIKSYKQSITSKRNKKSLGVPLNTLHLLNCPLCNKSFKIENASISANMVFSGTLNCTCGKILTINNGIITDSKEELIEQAIIENSSKKPTIQVTYEHVIQIKNSGDWIDNYIEKWDHSKGILFLNADSDLLMMDTAKLFKTNGIYILSCFDLISLVILKSKMELLDLKGSFILMYIKNAFPISENIHYFIDNGGNICDLIKKKTPGYSIEQLKPYINTNSELIKIHVGLTLNDCPLSESDPRLGHLLLENQNKKEEQLGMNILETHTIGKYKKIEDMEQFYSGIDELELIIQKIKL